MSRKKILIFGVLGVAIIAAIGGGVWYAASKKNTKPVATANAPAPETKPPTVPDSPKATTPTVPAPSQWPVKISMADAASLTVVVNKKHQLPSTYAPAGLTTYGSTQLRSQAAQALTDLVSDAAANGFTFKLISGYRSYSSQQSVYNSYVARDGQAAADTYSARPGFSEHQTGLAADVGNGTCDLETCFGDSAAGKWIAANAQNYGFIVRYPKGKEADTGYQYEPWHLRYLGVDEARSVYASGKTLDQYYNVPAGGYE